MSGGQPKIQGWKEQYCIGTWNVRSMNQGKLDVVKQEMERINIDLEIINNSKYSAAAAAKSLQSCPTLCDQPTRLPHPWDSPGKNTGVGCHFLLQCMKEKSESEVAQSCLTLSDPMDCSLPGSSIPGIFQARILERVAIAFSAKYSSRSHIPCKDKTVTLETWSHFEPPEKARRLKKWYKTEFSSLCKKKKKLW